MNHLIEAQVPQITIGDALRRLPLINVAAGTGRECLDQEFIADI